MPAELRAADLVGAAVSVDRDLIAEGGLWEFVRAAWHVVEPAAELDENWHLEIVCRECEDITAGRNLKVAFCLPAGTTKSSILCVFWPCWVWAEIDPTAVFYYSSHDISNALTHADRCKTLIQSPWFKRRWPEIQLDADVPESKREHRRADTRAEWYLISGGCRLTTSVNADKLGRHAHYAVADDPHARGKAESPTDQVRVYKWWKETMGTRALDRLTFRRVVNHQRLAQGDLAGRCIEQDGYRPVVFPLLFDPKHSRIHDNDPRTTEGEILCPGRYPPEIIPDVETTLGRAGFQAQAQQDPQPPGGLIFERDSFKVWKAIPARKFVVVDSWDGTFGKSTVRGLANLDEASRVVGQRWAFIGTQCFLIDEVRGRWSTADAVKRLIDFTFAPLPTGGRLAVIRVEDAGNSEELAKALRAEMLRRGSPKKIELVSPKDDKVTRANLVAPDVDAGQVYLPASWPEARRREWLDEVCAFPRKPNDRGDAMSQALTADQRPEMTSGPDGGAAKLRALLAGFRK